MQYCWREKNNPEKYLNGPFDSLIECKEDAFSQLEGSNEEIIEIGESVTPDPSDWITDCTDPTNLVNSMNEMFFDNYDFDDEAFYVIDYKEAKTSLENLLKQWAKEHIDCSMYIMKQVLITTTIEELTKELHS